MDGILLNCLRDLQRIASLEGRNCYNAIHDFESTEQTTSLSETLKKCEVLQPSVVEGTLWEQLLHHLRIHLVIPDAHTMIRRLRFLSPMLGAIVKIFKAKREYLCEQIDRLHLSMCSFTEPKPKRKRTLTLEKKIDWGVPPFQLRKSPLESRHETLAAPLRDSPISPWQNNEFGALTTNEFGALTPEGRNEIGRFIDALSEAMPVEDDFRPATKPSLSSAPWKRRRVAHGRNAIDDKIDLPVQDEVWPDEGLAFQSVRGRVSLTPLVDVRMDDEPLRDLSPTIHFDAQDDPEVLFPDDMVDRLLASNSRVYENNRAKRIQLVDDLFEDSRPEPTPQRRRVEDSNIDFSPLETNPPLVAGVRERPSLASNLDQVYGFEGLRTPLAPLQNVGTPSMVRTDAHFPVVEHNAVTENEGRPDDCAPARAPNAPINASRRNIVDGAIDLPIVEHGDRVQPHRRLRGHIAVQERCSRLIRYHQESVPFMPCEWLTDEDIKKIYESDISALHASEAPHETHAQSDVAQRTPSIHLSTRLDHPPLSVNSTESPLRGRLLHFGQPIATPSRPPSLPDDGMDLASAFEDFGEGPVEAPIVECNPEVPVEECNPMNEEKVHEEEEEDVMMHAPMDYEPNQEPLSFDNWAAGKNPVEIALGFMDLLEDGGRGKIDLCQKEQYGEIIVTRLF